MNLQHSQSLFTVKEGAIELYAGVPKSGKREHMFQTIKRAKIKKWSILKFTSSHNTNMFTTSNSDESMKIEFDHSISCISEILDILNGSEIDEPLLVIVDELNLVNQKSERVLMAKYFAKIKQLALRDMQFNFYTWDKDENSVIYPIFQECCGIASRIVKMYAICEECKHTEPNAEYLLKNEKNELISVCQRCYQKEKSYQELRQTEQIKVQSVPFVSKKPKTCLVMM